MLNKTMLIWALPRNWVTWFLCSVNLKTMRWPTALVLVIGQDGDVVYVVTVSQDAVLSCVHFCFVRPVERTELQFLFCYFMHSVGVNRKQMNSDRLHSCQMFSGLLQIMLLDLRNTPQNRAVNFLKEMLKSKSRWIDIQYAEVEKNR